DDGLNVRAANAWNREEEFDDEGARYECRRNRAHEGQHWDHRVADDMAEDDDLLPIDLSPSGSHVILIHDFEHAGAGDSRDIGGGQRAENNRREYHRFPVSPSSRPPDGWQPSKLYGKDRNEEDAKNEIGRRSPDRGEAHGDVVKQR